MTDSTQKKTRTSRLKGDLSNSWCKMKGIENSHKRLLRPSTELKQIYFPEF